MITLGNMRQRKRRRVVRKAVRKLVLAKEKVKVQKMKKKRVSVTSVV